MNVKNLFLKFKPHELLMCFCLSVTVYVWELVNMIIMMIISFNVALMNAHLLMDAKNIQW